MEKKIDPSELKTLYEEGSISIIDAVKILFDVEETRADEIQRLVSWLDSENKFGTIYWTELTKSVSASTINFAMNIENNSEDKEKYLAALRIFSENLKIFYEKLSSIKKSEIGLIFLMKIVFVLKESRLFVTDKSLSNYFFFCVNQLNSDRTITDKWLLSSRKDKSWLTQVFLAVSKIRIA